MIERLLAKEPPERYDSTRDLYRELKQMRDRLSETASASSVSATPGGFMRVGSAAKSRMLLGIGLAAALAAGMAALLIHPAPTDLTAYKTTLFGRNVAPARASGLSSAISPGVPPLRLFPSP